MSTERPLSPVDICNLALDYIGEASATSIEDPKNAREEIMSRWYDHVRRTVLREYVWNFAQEYKTIARSGDGVAQYADAFELPNDLVRLNVVGEDPDNPITDFELTGRTLLCNVGTSVAIRYNRSVTEVDLMDELFINIFAIRLALKVAYKFTKKKSVVDYLDTLLKEEEPKAISVDGQERPPRRRQVSKYLSARRGGGLPNPKFYSFSGE